MKTNPKQLFYAIKGGALQNKKGDRLLPVPFLDAG
jgi:hypothetical protein